MERTTIASQTLNNTSLKQLNTLRSKRTPQIRAHFERQRKLVKDPEQNSKLFWFEGMKRVLEEVDDELRVIPKRAPTRFLDVGCCPGGFTSYILSKNPNATGIGISLDVESGGHSLLLEEHLRPRLELHLADLTRYRLGCTPSDDPALQPFPHSPSFDLVLLDAHPLSMAGQDHRNADRLLVSQLIIGLQSISMSGTIVMKLSKPERVMTTQLLYMFDILSLSLNCWKPVSMHATRDTFYAVAKGVGYGRQGRRIPSLLHSLRVLWEGLTYGGIGGSLDFIVSKTELELTYAGRLQELCQHVWWVQQESLRAWHRMEGLAM